VAEVVDTCAGGTYYLKEKWLTKKNSGVGLAGVETIDTWRLNKREKQR